MKIQTKRIAPRSWREVSRYRVLLDGRCVGYVTGSQGSLRTTSWSAQNRDYLAVGFQTRKAAINALISKVEQ